jgi:hypothetical protein
MWRTVLFLTAIAIESACASHPASPSEKAYQESLAMLKELVGPITVRCVDHSDCHCQSFESKSAALPLRYSSTRYCPSAMRGNASVSFESFDSQGHLVDRGHFIKGLMEGEWTSYRPDGSLVSRTMFVSGCEDGETLGWYEDGSLEWRQNHDHGVPAGRWEHYIKTGEVDKILEWREGKLIKNSWRGSDGKLHDKPIRPNQDTNWTCMAAGRKPVQ